MLAATKQQLQFSKRAADSDCSRLFWETTHDTDNDADNRSVNPSYKIEA